MKSVIGIGIVALPYATQQTGYIWAIVLMFVILYCVITSTNFLIDIVDDFGANGILFHQAVQITLGGRWPSILDFLIVINQVGICIAYLIFFTEFLLIQFHHFGEDIPKIFPLLLTLIVIIPLTMIKNIHFFHKASNFGLWLALIGLSISTLYGWAMILFYEHPIYLEKPIVMKNSFHFIGVGIIAFEGILTVLPIRDSMQDRFKFKTVFWSVMLSTFILTLTVQQLSVLAYGDELKTIVIFNIQNRWLQFVAALFYGASLLLTYSLQLFPAIQIIEKDFSSRYSPEGYDNESHDIWATDMFSIILRLSITFVIYLTVYYVPNFSAFLNLLGSLLGAAMQYLFPCVMHMVYYKNKPEKQNQLVYTIILIVAIFAMVFGVLESINAMIKDA